MRKTIVRALVGVALLATFAARADWDPGDPIAQDNAVQMPDPTGLDIDFQIDGDHSRVLADDWYLKSRKAIDDIHFWVSVREDTYNGTEAGYWDGVSFSVSIWTDQPVGLDPNGQLIEYSRPLEMKWSAELAPGGYTARKIVSTEIEGWYDPYTMDAASYPDHNNYWQVNYDFDDALVLDGGIYWLVISAVDGEDKVDIGWKTSEIAWNDTAVYGTANGWQELIAPILDDQGAVVALEPVSLAFVITPEPSAAGLFLLGGLLAVARRRRK
jgi:hypothetical protein